MMKQNQNQLQVYAMIKKIIQIQIPNAVRDKSYVIAT